mgnify:CR=1 FL=1
MTGFDADLCATFGVYVNVLSVSQRFLPNLTKINKKSPVLANYGVGSVDKQNKCQMSSFSKLRVLEANSWGLFSQDVGGRY